MNELNPSIGYLGPAGTFTEQAVFTQPDLREMQHNPISDIVKVLHAVESGTVDFGLVAIENMIKGYVTTTLDELDFDTDTNLLIQREVIIQVNLNLMVHPGVTLDKIEHVHSHPVAYAQCRHYLTKNLPDASLKASSSTAYAAKKLAESGARNMAAIAPQRSAEIYGLDVLSADIEDHPENQTRFVLVGRDGIAPPTGRDKTTLLVYQHNDTPGSLLSLLAEFAARSVNLTGLQSRPTKKRLGQYCFLIDCEGHIADDVVADALRSLRKKAANIKFIGSYPSVYGTHNDQTTNQASAVESDEWIAELRKRIISPT